jgi:hypothetical protein
MPAPINIVRPTHGPTDTIAAPVYNAETIASANVRDASELLEGVAKLAGPGVAAPLLVPQANDPRLSDARPPTAHTHTPADITGIVGLIQAALDSRSTVGGLNVVAPGNLLIPVPAGVKAGLFLLSATNEPTGSVAQAHAFTLDFLDSELVHLSVTFLSAPARIIPIEQPLGAMAARISVNVLYPNTFVSWAFINLPT